MSQDHALSVPSTIINNKGFVQEPNPNPNPNPNNNNNNPLKRKRNLPGNPDPDAEVVALSPKSLMATNRFLCEICNKGFQRDQNLQLHRRGHNLPWKLKQRANKDQIRKKVYICPEKTCVHHDPSRALGDLTGIKKHFSRKHGEKKWKCEKCSKKYAVQSDWKAHSKICGTREYRCDCGTLFSRKDSFITHRAFCDALAEESARFTSNNSSTNNIPNFRSNEFGITSSSISNPHHHHHHHHHQAAGMIPQFSSVHQIGGGDNIINVQKPRLPLWLDQSSTTLPNSTGLSDQLAQMAAAAPMSMFGNSLSQMQWFNKYPKEEEENNKGSSYNNNNLSESMTSSSLYPNNHQQGQAQAAISSSSAHMSATALLQKAAQMGSTMSNNNNNNNNNTSGFGLMSSSSSFNNKNNLNELMMNSISSSSSLMMGNSTAASEVERSLTRDFLGVGGHEQGASRPFFQQELAKFMDMSQYTTTGHNHL
ncbi:hypothetical protein QYF36_005267 [Acer negundo]|nr:hypothetical protein QYF36_005267 [Acer negundo]